jgi:hypothetical protein
MMNQTPTDREELIDKLKFPPETMEYTNNPGKGNGLIYAGKFGLNPFENQIPRTTQIYKIITTDFADSTKKADTNIEIEQTEKAVEDLQVKAIQTA